MCASVGGSSTSMPQVHIIRNPTGGTIVSSPTNVAINSNRNFGSSKTLSADVYVGATGNTMTGGTTHIIIFQTTFGRLFATIDEVIPQGSSIGVEIKPPSGNSAMSVYAALICHTEDPKD